MVRRTGALVISKVLEAGGARDELARISRRTQVKNNRVRDMLNLGTGNLYDGSSWVVSHHSTVLKWRRVFRRRHGDLIGLGRR